MLAKEMVIRNMSIPVETEIEKTIDSKRYLKNAVINMSSRYEDLGEGYAKAWCYYAYKYISKLVSIIEPRCVVLWNEFYTFHLIFRGICLERKIPLKYMEFGCVPGTICIEEHGQQGESLVTQKYRKFNKKVINGNDLKLAEKVIEYLFYTGLNRNKQPDILIKNKQTFKL